MCHFASLDGNDYKNRDSLLKEILPLRTHIFPYSRREGTLAAKNFPGLLGRLRWQLYQSYGKINSRFEKSAH